MCRAPVDPAKSRQWLGLASGLCSSGSSAGQDTHPAASCSSSSSSACASIGSPSTSWSFSSPELLLFWAFSSVMAGCLGVVEFVGRRQALSGLSGLCTGDFLQTSGESDAAAAVLATGEQPACSPTLRFTHIVLNVQAAVYIAVVTYILAWGALPHRLLVATRTPAALMLGLFLSAFQLMGTIYRFLNSEREQLLLDAEREQLVLDAVSGLLLCLTVVLALMILLVSMDHAHHVASASGDKQPHAAQRYQGAKRWCGHARCRYGQSCVVNQSAMAQLEAQRPTRRVRSRREARILRTLSGGGRKARELYPILEVELECEEEEEALKEASSSQRDVKPSSGALLAWGRG